MAENKGAFERPNSAQKQDRLNVRNKGVKKDQFPRSVDRGANYNKIVVQYSRRKG